MRRLSLILAAVVMGFIMTSCGSSVKDSIMKDVDNYFTEAERKLAAIDNAEDFITFAISMNDRSEISNALEERYEGKEISEEDQEAIETYIYDRASAYNQAEGLKCGKFLTPRMERFVNAVEALYNNRDELDEETFTAMFKEMDEAENEVLKFAKCENIPGELINMFSVAEAKRSEMFDKPMAEE